jgi:hypothetical protein
MGPTGAQGMAGPVDLTVISNQFSTISQLGGATKAAVMKSG